MQVTQETAGNYSNKSNWKTTNNIENRYQYPSPIEYTSKTSELILLIKYHQVNNSRNIELRYDPVSSMGMASHIA